MPRCNQGNAFTNERWQDGDDELVDRLFVQERPDYVASAHQPDVLARLPSDAFGKGTNRLVDEVNAGGHGARCGPPREYVMRGAYTEARAELQTSIEGLATENFGVGGALEFRETVEALGSRPFRQAFLIFSSRAGPP
jgi:hypothetical protein